MGNDNEPISPAEYLKQTSAKKIVRLKSGRVFEIKKIRVRDYVTEANIPILTTDQAKLKDEEKGRQLWDKMKPEERRAMKTANDLALVKGVIKPPLTNTGEPGKLNVDDLEDNDYYELLDEIMGYSFGREGENIAPFRQQ